MNIKSINPSLVYISIHLNTSQYISIHLNTSQYISIYLNTSQLNRKEADFDLILKKLIFT
ncbi:hypothetical protein COTS27_01031 [Spirochaetota bacterium]|nr:hypothetical protein COTS27_01031 [Spirochaetota bacterium]